MATVETESERYQRYLAGREWSVRKEAVRQRSGGVCERCQYHQMNHVHHLTYARKYNEPLEDLQAICKGCHDFIHAKSNTDPAETAPVVFNGKQIRNVYLAGKITGSPWRDQITSESWSEENHGLVGDAWVYHSHRELLSSWLTVPECIAVPCKTNLLGMTGPWWRPFDMGHGHYGFNSYSHSCGTKCDDLLTDDDGNIVSFEPAMYTSDEDRRLRREIRQCILQSIWACDLLFAWIDTLDCFGTIAEIGIAFQNDKKIAIGMPEQFDASELWLAFDLADVVVKVDGTSSNPAKRAWDAIWKHK